MKPSNNIINCFSYVKIISISKTIPSYLYHKNFSNIIYNKLKIDNYQLFSLLIRDKIRHEIFNKNIKTL